MADEALERRKKLLEKSHRASREKGPRVVYFWSEVAGSAGDDGDAGRDPERAERPARPRRP